MDFTGRVEAALRTMANAALGFDADLDPKPILRRCALGFGSQPGFAHLHRSVYRLFSFSALFPEAELHAAETIANDAAALLRKPDPSPTELLWHHWLLLQAAFWKIWPLDELLNDMLWQRAFANQTLAGNLHPITAETTQEQFIYDELCAIHAAYRSASYLRNTQMLSQVGRIVEYHVANTQPDFSTTEPWGLAAFAALDSTQTFADQQLHDATTGNPSAIALALLADALITLRDAANPAG